LESNGRSYVESYEDGDPGRNGQSDQESSRENSAESNGESNLVGNRDCSR